MSSASDHRPSDHVFDFVPPFIDTDPISALEKTLRETTNPAQEKNIRVAAEILESDGEIPGGGGIADSKLVKGEEWKPVMGPFFTNAIASVGAPEPMPIDEPVPTCFVPVGRELRQETYGISFHSISAHCPPFNNLL